MEKAKGVKNLEIIVNEESIREVSLEQIAQLAFEYNFKLIPYEKTEEGKILIAILIRSSERILDDGTFLARTIILNTLYAPVTEYKRLLVYNHMQKTIEYVDENSDHNICCTYLISTYPHYLIKKVVPYIVNKMREKKKT